MDKQSSAHRAADPVGRDRPGRRSDRRSRARTTLESSATPASGAALSAAPVTLRAEVAAMDLPVAEILSLEPGSVIRLGATAPTRGSRCSPRTSGSPAPSRAPTARAERSRSVGSRGGSVDGTLRSPSAKPSPGSAHRPPRPSPACSRCSPPARSSVARCRSSPTGRSRSPTCRSAGVAASRSLRRRRHRRERLPDAARQCARASRDRDGRGAAEDEGRRSPNSRCRPSARPPTRCWPRRRPRSAS